MMEKNNATCSICGTEYYACFSCKEAMGLHPWKLHCCSADCFKVFQTVRGFSTGVYDKDEFKFKLKNLDLSNLENYREHIKALIKDALKEEEPIKVEAPIVEEIVEEETRVEPLVYSRKRNYKVNNEVEEAE